MKTQQAKPKNNQKGGNQKGKKLPEIEDFFTVFLQKKNRNLNKKLKHVAELEDDLKQKGGDRSQMTADQCAAIDRKSEILAQIADNDAVKAAYLEAYSKREDLPAKSAKQEAQPQVNVAEIKEQAMRHTIAAVSKLMMASYLCRDKASCEKFCAVSGVCGVESVFELNQCCFTAGEKDNNEKFAALQEMLVNWVQDTPVLSPANKPMCEYVALVNDMFNNESFAGFVPAEPKVEAPAPAPVQQVEAPAPVVAQPQSPAKSPAKSPSKPAQAPPSRGPSRKESAAQQEIFMADDDEDSEEADAEPTQTTQAKPAQKSPSKPAPVQKAPTKQTNAEGEDSEDDFIRVAPKNRDQEFRGRGRGGRGRGNRGGRGFYKDGKPREGQAQEGQEGRQIERKEWKGKDGEKREWKPREPRADGERGERGEYRGRGEGRGRGGRGRGGRGGRGRGGQQNGEQSERPPQGENGLKEIGVSEKPVAEQIAPVAEE